MDRQRARSVTLATRGATCRSDSRKRARGNSESPESSNTKAKDKRLVKKTRKVLGNSNNNKEQTKITAFGECTQNNTQHTCDTSDNESSSNMAVSQNQQFESLRDTLTAEFQKTNSKIDQCIKKMDDRMDQIDSKILDIENKLDNTNIDVKNLNDKVENNSEKANETQYTSNLAYTYAEQNEQYQRNFNVRIFNLPESPNESIEECENKVLALFNDTLGVAVKIESIDVLHRLGPKAKANSNDQEHQANSGAQVKENNEINIESETNTEIINGKENPQNKPNEENMDTSNDKDSNSPSVAARSSTGRPVIVSFVSRRVRRDVLANRSKLKKKIDQLTPPIIIVEDLTKRRHALFSKARENKDKFKKVWSKDGRIYARQHNGIDIPIDSWEDITNTPVMEKPQHYRRPPYMVSRGRGYEPRGYYHGFRGRGGRTTRVLRQSSWGHPAPFSSQYPPNSPRDQSPPN